MVDFRFPRLARLGPGRFAVSFPDEERDLLLTLIGQLRELLALDDGSTKRLFPTAYNLDPELDREYHALVHDELLTSRLAALDIVEETLHVDELDSEGLNKWMEALNSLRLVLGTKLDVSEELPLVDPEDPNAAAYMVYEYLGWVLEQAVQAMLTDYPE